MNKKGNQIIKKAYQNDRLFSKQKGMRRSSYSKLYFSIFR